MVYSPQYRKLEMALILAVDRCTHMCRAVVNMIGTLSPPDCELDGKMN